jgi:carbon-monoxide dehydrogenase large subunit
LGVPFDRIEVVHGDTDRVERGGGTSGSRSAVLGGTAVGIAADLVAGRLKRLASERLEAAPEDLVLDAGRATVAGTDVGVDVAELVRAHGSDLTEATDFVSPGLTYPFGTHVCSLEIDPATGEIRILGFVAVDDCGTVINPIITEGQVHGGVMQGVSHALREAVRYDEHGTLLTANWTTYAIPSISQAMEIDSVRTETPSPNNPLGLKGVGEAGTTGSTPAVANAVFDALSRLGIDEADLPMPYTPDRVWLAVAGGRAS